MPKRAKRITVELLREKGACESEMGLFERVFPGGAEVTVKNVVRALETSLSVTWVESHFFSGRLWRKLYRETEKHWDKFYEEIRALPEEMKPEERLKVGAEITARRKRRRALSFVKAWNGTLIRRRKRKK